jgi:hypothetical protein
LSQDIEAVLTPLIGKPLFAVHRAAEREGLSFGERWEMCETRGRGARQVREISEYALHVACAWRFRTSNELLVASRDVYAVLEGHDSWDQIGSNRRDVRVAGLLRPRLPAVVREIHPDPVGGFALHFTDGLVFEVFPDDTDDDEHWRMFQPFQTTPHYVLKSSGLELH